MVGGATAPLLRTLTLSITLTSLGGSEAGWPRPPQGGHSPARILCALFLRCAPGAQSKSGMRPGPRWGPFSQPCARSPPLACGGVGGSLRASLRGRGDLRPFGPRLAPLPSARGFALAGRPPPGRGALRSSRLCRGGFARPGPAPGFASRAPGGSARGCSLAWGAVPSGGGSPFGGWIICGTPGQRSRAKTIAAQWLGRNQEEMTYRKKEAC